MFTQLLPHFYEVGCVSLLDNGSIMMRNMAIAEEERLASQWAMVRLSAVDSEDVRSLGIPPFEKSEWTRTKRDNGRWQKRNTMDGKSGHQQQVYLKSAAHAIDKQCGLSVNACVFLSMLLWSENEATGHT